MTFRHLFVFLSVAIFTGSCINDRRSDRREEPAQPNILLAISDDQSYNHTSFTGCGFVGTPAFDRIASEGIYFTNCYAGSPGCAPSRSALVTGRHHWQNEQSGQHASSWMKKYVPFVDMLDSAGYYTGRTGKGVSPFRYARSEEDSLMRSTDAAGIEHSRITYNDETEDERFADQISSVNYFENFKYFMEQQEEGKPFFFWYGSTEPHRAYEQDSWKRFGKDPADVEVPGFLPDHDVIRRDLLDYAVEIEWFDLHLSRMIAYLEEIGELENTIIIVTSDNGMPFPRAKANGYDHGVHVPLAVLYQKAFPGERVVDDLVSFADFAPTILELSGASPCGMLPMRGKSFLQILKSKKQGIVDNSKNYVFAGRERHSSSRHLNWGYPMRIMRSRDYLFIWNMKPDRWPAGAPQRIDPENPGLLLPMYGLDENGKHHSEWAFTDVDAAPSKSFLVEYMDDPGIRPFFDLSYLKRPEFEMYYVPEDPGCVNNLYGDPAHREMQVVLKKRLIKELADSKDPRIAGPDKEIFDSYVRYSRMRAFPKPD
ncbi:MAG: sulfatase [Bacteroidales bacterium]|nr:sulfatase [Bacteroidales bacterium]